MITGKVLLSGIPALIENKAHFGLLQGLEKKQTDWLGLLAFAGDDPKPGKPDDKDLQAVFDWQNKIILVAEDEDTNFLFLKTALLRTKAVVIRAKHGREAVDMVRNNPNIDLVLMDIKMPVMNGVDATKVIKSFNNKIVVIAQTAYANEDDRYIYLKAGCNDFLSKPITRDKLLSTISQYF